MTIHNVYFDIECEENFFAWKFKLNASYDYTEYDGLELILVADSSPQERKPVASIIGTVLRALKVGCLPLNYSRDIIDPTEAIFCAFRGNLIVGEKGGNESTFGFDIDLKTNNIEVSRLSVVLSESATHTIGADIVSDMIDQLIDHERNK